MKKNKFCSTDKIYNICVVNTNISILLKGTIYGSMNMRYDNALHIKSQTIHA